MAKNEQLLHDTIKVEETLKRDNKKRREERKTELENVGTFSTS